MPISDYGGFAQSSNAYRCAEFNDLESLQATVLDANRSGTPIRIRGNGHSMNGSSLPRAGELLIATGALRHVRFERTGTVTVGAGAAIWDVDRFLRDRGYRLRVVNDGGKPAATVGGFVCAGGFGRASAVEGGFWETVASVTMVTGDGRIVTSRPGEKLFPWLFGSMGQLGIIYEVMLRIAAVDDAAPTYPLGECEWIEARPTDWEKIAWLTLLAPARHRQPAVRLLAALRSRHAHAWNDRTPYLYELAFRTFNPPLIHPSQESLIAAGIWGTPRSPAGFASAAMAVLESDFMAIVHGHPEFRRYVQTEMTFHPRALLLNLGAGIYRRFCRLKHALDPNHLLTRGVLDLADSDATGRHDTARALTC
jgi:FAD/FMN-containing dehydrogenase